jgi:hypothetical protein
MTEKPEDKKITSSAEWILLMDKFAFAWLFGRSMLAMMLKAEKKAREQG